MVFKGGQAGNRGVRGFFVGTARMWRMAAGLKLFIGLMNMDMKCTYPSI